MGVRAECLADGLSWKGGHQYSWCDVRACAGVADGGYNCKAWLRWVRAEYSWTSRRGVAMVPVKSCAEGVMGAMGGWFPED